MDLNKKFNIVPSDESKNSLVVGSTIEDEFEYVRNNIINNIELGQEALEEMFSLAKSSQNARSFEVLNQMLKTMNEMNKDLGDIRTRKRELQRDPNEQQPTNVHNTVILTTHELQKMLAAKPSENPSSDPQAES